ncbi:MBL fold metallo-hydrolase [Parashewanella tropica]|uniref:MBL fold metallo-hydrolase n=1 Tax=Parashewanella tropica TaxID=2547970 RepID=UPI00105A38BE|nr:MBL fold metallo-hydrolase [Parashewanella tropica]
MYKNLKSLAVLISFSLLSTQSIAASQCDNLKVQTLGAGGPEVSDGLASASFLVWVNGKAKVMVDAGGGSSLNFEKSGAKFTDIDAMLFTHLHVDHSAALPVYIKAGYFTNPTQALNIYGPTGSGDFPSTTTWIKGLFDNNPAHVYSYLNDNINQQRSTQFLVDPHNVKPKNTVWHENLKDGIKISAINVNHGPVPALAWRIDYKQCSVTFSGDMSGTSGNLPKLAYKTNLLVANNAIPHAASRIAKRLHMTPETIGKLANESHAKQLALAHFMNRTINRKNESVSFIQKEYSGKVSLVQELKFIEIK